ncbi:flagellar filament capping protein FliD [Campylobacter novaezeelandiae]|uniref:Flagellar hook-associated protein 2 n=1 Tax=Campylobacter novaezeelandiae TaxID=2267891 RepID=A0A4Q9JU00_9BACT|nr:flagellar filament capping protein FliD [Campylobacter novaezeelandiae]TBR81064.1 flagellar filament capping protein FliD [Campylobacter novaezeelandiae]
MAFGSLSSLGFGSGVLTQDVIDKLKKADEASRINPYTKKIEENNTKQKDLTEIKTKLLSFQTAVSALGDATVFAKRKVNASVTTNPPASLTADSGVALQSMKVNVTQLAQKDVYQSKGLANDGGYIDANLEGTASFTLFQNGKEYTISYDKNTTYKDLADKINQATDGNIQAKIVNTGEKDAPYRLTLSSKETGEDNAISFFDGSKAEDGTYKTDANTSKLFSNLGWELHKPMGGAGDIPIDSKDFKGYGIEDDPDNPLHIQKAQNAEFTLDGIKMIRQNNTVTDLGVGITLTLNSTGEINFDIQQDNESVVKAMNDLVDSYNDLIVNLQAATDYNSETGTKGTLQGITEVNSIRSTIISTLFGSQSVDGFIEDANGNKIPSKVMVSLQDYGLSLSDSGTLSFSQSTFEEKMNEDPSFVESFFAGITQYKDISYTGDLVETSDAATLAEGEKEIKFEKGKFTIVFNDQTYDLSKTRDGKEFVLKGETKEEQMKNLVEHINSLNIDGLNVRLENVEKDGKKGVIIKFNSDNGSDLTIKGDDEFLKQFGLKNTTVISEPIEGLGVFAQLKSKLQGMTGSNGSLTKLDESLTNDTKSLTKSKESTQALIDSKYETMQNQFLQYESILNKLNTQLNTITNMINAMNNQNS